MPVVVFLILVNVQLVLKKILSIINTLMKTQIVKASSIF